MNALLRARTALGACALLLLSLAGCGGSDSKTDSAAAASNCADSSGCSTTYVALTDADGDFLSYTVDVVSLRLRRSNGTVVETLPSQTRVDFAQYVELTEFITAATVPNGSYVEGTLRLDYSNAAIAVEQNGQAVAANVVGANGAPLGLVDVRVVLDNRNRLVVSPGRPSLLTLDFNLAATNSVDLTTTPVTVTARPTLIASLEPVQEKDLRLRGPLVSVNVAQSYYVADLRPFNHPRARHGAVRVHTTSTTAFEINGQSSTGATGLQAMAALSAGTATVAVGTLSTTDRAFTAERVYAGSSVPGAGYDVLVGTVIARNGNELTVRGGTIVRNDATSTSDADNRASFNRGDTKVVIGPNTTVLKDGSGAVNVGAQAISVGQLINAFGTATQSSGVTTIDATQGRVRMHHSHLLGTVVNAAPQNVIVNVASINGRQASIFDFAGTGQSSALDADPANYEVQTGALSVAQLLNGRAVRVFGFVTPFGTAPPDFEARTLVSYAQLRSELAIGWGSNGTTAPFSSINNNGIVLDLSNTAIGARHHLHTGPLLVDLLSLSSSPTITAPTSGRMMFVIALPGGIQHYSNFAEFTAALTTTLNGVNHMVGFTAGGEFNGNSNTLTANIVAAVFR
jgi:hypothetical protein